MSREELVGLAAQLVTEMVESNAESDDGSFDAKPSLPKDLTVLGELVAILAAYAAWLTKGYGLRVYRDQHGDDERPDAETLIMWVRDFVRDFVPGGMSMFETVVWDIPDTVGEILGG